MNSLATAIAIANDAHAGQLDRGGEPYILHPLRVMLAMTTEVGRIVGVLHDVAEKCPGWSIERIATRGFATGVTEPLRLLTRGPDVPYYAYIKSIVASGDTVARMVKIQDLLDNLRKARLRRLPPIDRIRLEGRYIGALILLDAPFAGLQEDYGHDPR